MKKTHRVIYFLLISLLVTGCSDFFTKEASKELQEENSRLSRELELTQEENQELKFNVKKLESELRRVLNRHDFVIFQFVKFTQDDEALEGALLKYFGFNDISKTNDAYIDLAKLGLSPDGILHSFYLEDRHAIRYYAQRLDRSPSKLELLFNRYKSAIFQAIPQYVYDNSYANEYVEFLLKSRKNIMGDENYEKFFEKLSSDERLNNREKKDELLAEFEKQFGVLGDELALLRRTEHKSRLKYWGYSFWYRRYTEGNEKVVESILNEIATKYSSDAP